MTEYHKEDISSKPIIITFSCASTKIYHLHVHLSNEENFIIITQQLIYVNNTKKNIMRTSLLTVQLLNQITLVVDYTLTISLMSDKTST